MRTVLTIVLCLVCSIGYAQPKSMADIKATKRVEVTQAQLSGIRNYSKLDLIGKKLSGHYYRKNFSYCDFTNADLREAIFSGCNFSFSIGLDTAKYNKQSKFEGCNFTGADLPDAKYLKSCNVRRMTDEEIYTLFNR